MSRLISGKSDSRLITPQEPSVFDLELWIKSFVIFVMISAWIVVFWVAF
jgi:hypothetical protein